jgi:hypothetical protein
MARKGAESIIVVFIPFLAGRRCRTGPPPPQTPIVRTPSAVNGGATNWALPGCRTLRLAEPSDVQGNDALPTPKTVAADRAKQMCPIPIPVVPASQEHAFIGIKEAPITIMPGLPFRKQRCFKVVDLT